jgi:hypothetical protein
VIDSLTYVYALVKSARSPSVRDIPATMPGARSVRALEAGGGVWAIVSSVPARDYDEAALAKGLQNLDWVGRRAMAHEAVVEHFLTVAPVLPMQLFTLFTTDERALAHVARDRARINRIFTRIAGQLEWGLRLSFDEKGARAAIEQKHAGAKKAGARSMPAPRRPARASAPTNRGSRTWRGSAICSTSRACS